MKFPSVHCDSKNRYFISFVFNSKRYRLFNGSKLGIELYPNSHQLKYRRDKAFLLANEVYLKYLSGANLFNQVAPREKPSDINIIREAFLNKINGIYSDKYKYTMKYLYDKVLTNSNSMTDIKVNLGNIMHNGLSRSSYSTYRRHLSVVFNIASQNGLKSNPMTCFKPARVSLKLHEPFDNVLEVLDEIRQFNKHLHLCCMLTYGCLLRPHQEIRNLKWGDFNSDLNQIKLSGTRNKSGRNRIVPIPDYIKDFLEPKKLELNIFSSNTKSFNPDYFKTLWTRYRRSSILIKKNQTIYSFRHTGALNIYEKTRSLKKVQVAMAHSNLSTTFIYLRGLDNIELERWDMPSFEHFMYK